MKHLLLQLVCLLLLVDFSSAQQFSIDVPVLLEHIQEGVIEQQLDIPRSALPAVAALSVVLKGKNCQHNAVRCLIREKGQWQLIPHFHESEEAGKYVSELYFLPEGSVNEIQLRIELDKTLDPQKIVGRIHLFGIERNQPDETSFNMEATPSEREACNCPQPVFIPRTVWGSSLGLTGAIYVPPAVYTDVTHLIVHHSAGTNTSSNWAGVVAAIFDYHVNTNGWSDVGYNWLIDPNGVVYEGRGGGDNVRGAHMCGYNNNTMGVCLLGNFVNVPPPPAAMAALKRLLAWKACKEDINPITSGPIVSHTGFMSHISGHRDGCAPNYTECPGGLLYAQLSTLRNSVVEEINTECSAMTEVENAPSNSELSLSPNPVDDKLTVRWHGTGRPSALILMDALGRIIEAYLPDASSETLEIDTAHLPVGIYRLVGQYPNNMMTSIFVKY